jgi:outer membrane protein OmpA-like peptidoglycan-associated protein
MTRVLALLLVLLAAPAFGQGKVVGVTTETIPFTARVIDVVAPVQNMITVTQVAREVKIELPADVLFDFDKSEIRPDAAVALAAAAELLKKGVNGAVKIDGHTDSRGAAAYNQKLSQDRARSVQAWFAKNGGLPAALRYTLTGYGATRPAAPNAKPDGSDNPDGRQRNRRVEITFTPR